jgi:hypothetical protein
MAKIRQSHTIIKGTNTNSKCDGFINIVITAHSGITITQLNMNGFKTCC